MIDPFLIINKFLLNINGSETKLLEILIVLVALPVIKSTTINLPLSFDKYRFVLPITKPIGFILARFFFL